MSAPLNILFPLGSYTRKDINMLSREDFYMIKQMRRQGADIIDIATQVGCSERTVRRYLKYPGPPARKNAL
jgi:AraC-like DNA-binding protein